MSIINLTPDVRSSHRERIEKRIQMLRRKGWKWVKHSPDQSNSMCAILDRGSGCKTCYQMNKDTATLLNNWLAGYTNGRWKSIVDYNDARGGAQTVDDVVTMMEKFAAEL